MASVTRPGVAAGEKVVRTDDRETHEILCALGDLLRRAITADPEHTVMATGIEPSVGRVHTQAVNVSECRVTRVSAIAAGSKDCDSGNETTRVHVATQLVLESHGESRIYVPA